MTDKREAEFQANLLAMFKIEAEEHLKAISDGLLALEGNLSNEERKAKVETIFRESHSLKGAARSINYQSIQSICQSLENIFSAWKQGRLPISKEVFDPLYAAIDLIGKLVAYSPSDKPKEISAIFPLIDQLDQIAAAASEQASIEPQPSSHTPSPIAEQQPAPSLDIPSSIPKDEPKTGPIPTSSLSPSGLAQDKTIRVSLNKLDKLFQEIEEMLMLKLASRQQMNNLILLRDTLKQSDRKWKTVQPDIHTLIERLKKSDKSPAIHKELAKALDYINWQQEFIKSIKNHLSHLIKMSAQDHRAASVIVDTLLDDTRKVLMQPLSTLLDVFPRMVRDISHSQEKEIHFEVVGEDIEIDRRILEEMKDPLMHIIRNSIDHGIETPAVRAKVNKPPSGTIRVSASQTSGNSMELIISDDGQGINRAKVKESAIRQGILSPSDAAAMGDQESLMLIFQSGISTKDIITELSGRGLGLGIASEKVDKLGGHLSVESKQGEGTSFRIVLPLTLATFRGMQIKTAGQDFIMPSHNIKRVIRINREEIKSVENREVLYQNGKPISFVPLSQVLDLPAEQSREKERMVYAVIVKAAEKTIAFGVDKILYEQEILVKGLGKQLKQLKYVLGASISESGQVIAILNPQDLVKSAVQLDIAKKMESTPKELKKGKKTILIAEDSMTSRLLLKNILEIADYEVKAAVDGLEAFSIFKIEHIDLIISDVEMPRMDGFTLTSKVRELDKGKNIPIILCSAKESPEDLEQGMNVGANAYLEKSRFTQKSLLDIIQKLL
ncbi:hybrid sensor histidine kinase/response regulator [Candidatus Protochlamydia phocaeensis]|uniref:hybrid sensor histidine kinase/response regulator n=1 Tax=Candidatus Protochlamydia phocaeensis TaxID=1414722 RepID=UPI00083888D4|nr:hybrid sensor histidine kinase/response regulator [Candidatus Protochlamydia phocaeensis]